MSFYDNDFFKHPFFKHPFFKGSAKGKHFVVKPKKKRRKAKS